MVQAGETTGAPVGAASPQPAVSYLLTLYVAGQSARSQRAAVTMRNVCARLPARCELTIVDVLELPQLAEEDRVLATPTVIRQRPLPVRRVIGDLSDPERVVLSLDLPQAGCSPRPERVMTTPEGRKLVMAEDQARLREELERRTHELRTTQEQLRNLIERNADAIVVIDSHGLVRFVNPAAEQLFGRPTEQLLGTELGLPLVVNETTEIDVLGNRGAPRIAEMRVVDTEWNGQPALLAVLRDVTERKRLEQERAQLLREQLARHQAEQALRERDEFMALASHELKTPVSTLSATAQLLLRQLDRHGRFDPEQLQRALDRVHDQARRLARLVDHLLDVSRINSGKLVLEPEQVDLRNVVEEVVASCQLTTGRHTIRLHAPRTIEARVDPIRIGQVVTNLLDNAIKYSPDGGAIDVELGEGSPGMARLSVRDRGLGIPPDRRERLFERFYRAHADGHVSGMGLGLFITHHIVELHGGGIRVETPPEGGSCFTVELPTALAPRDL